MLVGVTACAFSPLFQLTARSRWWQEGWAFALAILIAGFYAVDGELRPDRADTWTALRMRRFALPVVSLLFATSLIFPTFGPFWVLWILVGTNLMLLAFAFVPRVRTVSLCVSSVGALGLTVIDDTASWTLIPIGLAWALLPALDRMAIARLRLPRGRAEAPGFRLALLSGIAAFGLGGLAFGLANAALPASTRSFEVVNLLEPREAGSTASVTPEMPALELFFLLVAIVVFLFLVTRIGGESAERSELDVSRQATAADPPRPLAPTRLEVDHWPASPRRDLVRTYLEHRRKLDAHGLAGHAGSTPTRLAQGVPESVRAAAAALAARFGRARWAKTPVGSDDVEAARLEAAHVERSL
jgi:hypothetical protein